MSGLGLYLHFPWCVRKCPYCDFNSHPLRDALQHEAYLEALEADLAAQLADVPAGALTSVFCGGGTPSLFPPETFARLIEQLAPWLAADAEITMEANPGTVEHHDFAGYRRAGINRLSLGAQSFSAEKLMRLGRIHGPDDTVRAYEKARRAGFDNVNLDLMYGLPEQSVAEALGDLEQAIALGPEHLSWYQLTLEPKTEFARRPPPLPDHDRIADMERGGLAYLAEAGYRRYEVSAFARNGRACRHNLTYWQFGDYVGAGAGAHGKRSQCRAGRLAIERTRKPSQPRRYLADPTATETVPVTDGERRFEFLLNVLRLVDGVPHERFPAATGLPIDALEPEWSQLVAEGLLRRDRIATTPRGLRYLDGVLQRFLT
ncbi:MAG TPA: radical SAM family heme chaperone HemW [Pseudomonadales bacterium]